MPKQGRCRHPTGGRAPGAGARVQARIHRGRSPCPGPVPADFVVDFENICIELEDIIARRGPVRDSVVGDLLCKFNISYADLGGRRLLDILDMAEFQRYGRGIGEPLYVHSRRRLASCNTMELPSSPRTAVPLPERIILRSHLSSPPPSISGIPASSGPLGFDVVSHLHFDESLQPHYAPASSQRIAPRAQLMRDWDGADLDAFRSLLQRLPKSIFAEIETIVLNEMGASLIEILLQGHRPPVLRFADDSERDLSTLVSVDEALELLLDGRPEGEVFSSDNRAGIPGTLHRVAATRDRLGRVIALTYRIGRHKPGSAMAAIPDVVAGLKRQQSLLVVGPPGCGKTTLLRDITRILADEYRLRSVVVDTSMEIAGDDSAPHACIGRALRMPVADRHQQPEVLLEAVQNQTPQVIIVDEIGTRAEVDAACSISQRGVGLVATAHGKSLQSILSNKELRPLLGHFNLVTLNADEARLLSPSHVGVPKRSRLERTSQPAFCNVVEIQGRNRWRVYNNLSGVLDDYLAGKTPVAEDRWLDDKGLLFSMRHRPPFVVDTNGHGMEQLAA